MVFQLNSKTDIAAVSFQLMLHIVSPMYKPAHLSSNLFDLHLLRDGLIRDKPIRRYTQP